EVVHTDLAEPFKTDITGHQYFQVFVDESSRDKRVYGLKTKNAATDATAAYIDQMAREGIPVKCIGGDGAGEVGRSVKFQMMLANNGTRWRKSPPRTPQSNGITERVIKQLMGVATSKLAKAGLGDEYWFFAITDVAFKTGGMRHEYLGGETPCERLTGKSVNYDRLRAWGSECYVHQDKQQRGTSSKFHPYAKRGKIMGHDRTSLGWHIWLPQEVKLVTSAHVTFEPDEHITDFVGEREIMTLTDNEEISDTEDDSDRDFDIAVDPIPQATAVGKKSICSPSEQRRTARIAEQPRVNYRSLHSGDTEELGENIVNLLRSSTDDAYCLMGMAGDISIGHQEPSTIAEALAGPDAEHSKKAMEQEMEGQRTKGTFHEGESLPPVRRPVKTRFIFKIERTAYGDSDWGNDTTSRRSVKGYLILINGAPVAWKSKMQGAVTTSSSEAEWTAMVHGMRHAILLRGILGELGILKGVTVWYGDNQGAIQAAVIEGFNGRTMHVDIKLKCTREYVNKGIFRVKYIPTTLQLADILTKRL
ncbi:unnamed protein product, partial [Choristocarpus tenellus]